MKKVLILLMVFFMAVLCTTFTLTYIYRTKAETVSYTFEEDGQIMSFNVDYVDEKTCNLSMTVGDVTKSLDGVDYEIDGNVVTFSYQFEDSKDRNVIELTFDENNVIIDLDQYIDEYRMTLEDMSEMFNENYAELNARWAELKESQTYTMLVTIVTIVIGLGYSIVTFSKKVKTIRPTEEGLNETIKEVIKLKSELNEIVAKINEANANQETYKGELKAISDSIVLMACNDREKVINGTSKAVCDLLGGDSDVKDKA